MACEQSCVPSRQMLRSSKEAEKEAWCGSWGSAADPDGDRACRGGESWGDVKVEHGWSGCREGAGSGRRKGWSRGHSDGEGLHALLRSQIPWE